MVRLKGLLVLCVGLVLGGVATLTATAGHAGEPADWTPPPETIVAVEGDAANGFGIYHLDGSALFPPTRSEAMAECTEYDSRVERVRCYTEVRVWYRDLADLQVALRYAYIAALHD